MAPKRKAPQNNSNGSADIDYNRMDLKKLKNECKKRNLDESGKKAEVIARLCNSDQQDHVANEAINKRTKSSENVEPQSCPTSINVQVKKSAKVDDSYDGPKPCTIYADYHCVLEQSNSQDGENNNCIIQLIDCTYFYYVWMRSSCEEEEDSCALNGPVDNIKDAIKMFNRKFKDLTKNNWSNRGNFIPYPGQYILIEMVQEDQGCTTTSTSANTGEVSNDKPGRETLKLMEFISDKRYLEIAIENIGIHEKVFPSCVVNKGLIVWGFSILEDIEEALQNGEFKLVQELSKSFYHGLSYSRYGGKKLVDNEWKLNRLRKELQLLMDVWIARDLVKETTVLNDENQSLTAYYHALNVKLTLMNPGDETYNTIENYFMSTRYSATEITHIWQMDRPGEDERFALHDAIQNRRLLWFCTHAASTASILKYGLRISPLTNEFVGPALCFNSTVADGLRYLKSLHHGIIFLAEVAIGKEHQFKGVGSNRSLTAASQGCDSVVVSGDRFTDPENDSKIRFHGKEVPIHQGMAIEPEAFGNFYGNAYFIYNESQIRLRYIIRAKHEY